MRIDFLKLENGTIPFLDWIQSLDKETQLRIRKRITRIETGNFGDTKSISNGVYEIRFHFHAGYRVYFGKENNTAIILISAGNKIARKVILNKP